MERKNSVSVAACKFVVVVLVRSPMLVFLIFVRMFVIRLYLLEKFAARYYGQR